MRLEEAEPVLHALLADKRLREEIGQASRRWMEAHYDDATLVEHYRRAYFDLFEAPGSFGVPRFRSHAEQWRAVALHDHAWDVRRRAGTPWWRQAADAFKRAVKGAQARP